MDLRHALMHEIGHLLGYEHSEDEGGLMSPVLAAGRSRAGSRAGSSAEAVEPLGQAELRIRPSSFVLGPLRSVDGVFADLGREGDEELSSAWMESKDGEIRAASMVKSGQEATQARVPRRSRMPRYERELDDWFAELGAAE